MSTTAGTLAVSVPDIGDFRDVPVIEILVSVGDQVAVDDPLVALESDKATLEVPSPAAGVVKAVHVELGQKVSQGTLLLDLATEGGAPADGAAQVESTPPAPAPSPAPPNDTATPEAPPPPVEAVVPPTPPTPTNGNGLVYASPAVRRLARELGIDLHAVAGSGRKGRVTPDDVRTARSGGAAAPAGAASGVTGLDLAPWPVVDFEQYGPVERVQRSRIQRISGPNLARNWVMIPHVTHNDEADITELEAWRKQLNAEQGRDGAKVTLLAFLVKAAVAALKEFPTFNAALDGDELVLRRYYNIGFAADTPGGLVVPVIREADVKGIIEIAAELGALAAKARDGKLSPADMSGGTFTISSLGGIGGTSFTPIINAPEVAILGVTRAAIRPVWDANAETFLPRLMVPLSLSYDHRVIDGAAAARFVVHLVKVLSDLRRALL